MTLSCLSMNVIVLQPSVFLHLDEYRLMHSRYLHDAGNSVKTVEKDPFKTNLYHYFMFPWKKIYLFSSKVMTIISQEGQVFPHRTI